MTIHAAIHAGRRGSASALALLACAAAHAQEPGPTLQLDPLSVTATRALERAFDVPASVDIVDATTIRLGQPLVNLSESLQRIPGIVALNRQNYAQDLQISSRGFGARATFGVRGVRLYQDDIPATMPDGQGQTGSMSLLSARRIEVLRGPFSTLYGNASGGVINVITEDGTPRPEVTLQAGAGSYRTWTGGIKFTGTAGAADYVIAGSRFDTEGYRDHSAARRDLLNVKVNYALAPATRMTVIANAQDQPETQDPLGLTRAQWQADPRRVDAAALLFDTRKTIHQRQGGARVEHRVNQALTASLGGYAGQRAVRQYLALSGVGATSSGGVTDLDRSFGGAGARAVWRGALASQPLTVNVGADVDRQSERRRGFVNDSGALGELRRDEDDVVSSVAFYAQAEWLPLPRWSLRAGVRTSTVRFTSDDFYVTAANPNDSGRRKFQNTSPVFGVVWHAHEALNVYASYGEGFETPTFAELAYRPGGGGLNFALDASTSRAAEVGVKMLAAGQRAQVAAFAIDTEREIVVDSATGGRTIYRNAGPTRRRGVEAQWTGALGAGFTSHVAFTYVRAVFEEGFVSATASVPAQARLPGVPARSAYAEVAWASRSRGLNAGVELVASDRIFVNDRNTDATPRYAVVNARAGIARQVGGIGLDAFVRVNNLGDRRYIGSVIVGDTNGRFFEPAPGRNWFVGASAHAAF